MKSYLITYDLLKPGQDYSALIGAIRLLDPMAWHGLQSVWVVRSTLNEFQIRNYLMFFVDVTDKLLVIETGAWAAYGLPATGLLAVETNTLLIAA